MQAWESIGLRNGRCWQPEIGYSWAGRRMEEFVGYLVASRSQFISRSVWMDDGIVARLKGFVLSIFCALAHTRALRKDSSQTRLLFERPAATFGEHQ